MKSLIRIAIILMYLISFQLQANAQNLPLACGGSKVRYGVTGDPGSTYVWQIVGGVILKNYNDSVDVQWDSDLLPKNLSVSEHTSTCTGLPATATVPVSLPTLDLGPPLQTCINKPLQFNPEGDFTNFTFLWNTGIRTRDITLSKEGMYKLKITDTYGCSALDSVYLTLNKLPVVDLGRDSILCAAEPYVLHAGTDGIGYSWWNTKSNTQIPGNQESLELIPGNLPSHFIAAVVINTDGCSNSDTVQIYDCKDMDIPNAFTPNDDGENDTWRLVFLLNYSKASVDIFDRWGRRVFHCSDGSFPSNGWDGTQNGRKLPMDTYFYVIKLNDGSTPISGGITLIR